MIMKKENQKTASINANKTINKIDITIHSTMDNIRPPIPSPERKLGKSTVGDEFPTKFIFFMFLSFGKLSIKRISV